MIELSIGAATHVGRNPGRTNNEDRYLVTDQVWAVADGVGGHAGGEVAAGVAVDVIATQFDPSRPRPLASVIEEANQAVWQKAGSDPELTGMATTITAIARLDADGADHLIVANVGDSRTYLLRQGELSQLSVDHSQVEEMVRDGLISRQEAARHPYRHVVTRVLGMEPEVRVDTWDIIPAPGDRFLLCSDGLIDEVDDATIAAILQEGGPTQATVDRLVGTALDNGGSDNVTVVLLDVVDSSVTEVGPLPAAPAEAEAAAPLPEQAPVAPPPTARAVTGMVPVVKRRRVTFRVVAFVVALIVVLGGAVAAVVWYARGGYYVGLSGTQVTIFKGRPGGVLWFKPTVAQRTDVTTAQVLSSSLPQLQSGMEEPSLTNAHQYVANLVSAYEAATPSPTTTTTTAPSGGSTTTTTVAP
ncbi:MAG TPA: PP2C family serine/threonine-protein phosphatase [Acidimicrobiales bacterium]|nr:PP2C family serine/threonine-protein phosphatase [Acidimicrobiales bacterium]